MEAADKPPAGSITLTFGDVMPPVAAAAAAGAERKEYTADEHRMSFAQLEERFGTVIAAANPALSPGLTEDRVAQNRARYGKNMLTPPKETPEIVKLLLQFTDGLMVLLLVAGALCFLAYGLQSDLSDKTNAILGAVLIAVVVLTCIMNYWQERVTSSVMKTFKKMLPAKCVVVRAGKEAKIPAVDLVPGDIVKLGLGDRVPADVRIISTKELKTECSSLTGEPDAIPATVEPVHEDPREARNLVFNSSLVMSGSGVGVVVKTGDASMIGTVAGLTSNTVQVASQLQREIHHLVWIIVGLAISSAVVLFGIGALRSGGNKELLISAFINGFIIVLVANSPEGLPATVVSQLTITAQRLGRANILIKQPQIIETLGAASVIASDKTGTLTQNRMTVSSTWLGRQVHSAEGTSGGGSVSTSAQASVAIQRLQSTRAPLPTSRSVVVQAAGELEAALAAKPGSARRLAGGGSAPLDPAYAMTIGRSAVPAGDGTMRIERSKEGTIGRGSSEATMVGTFSSFVQFAGAVVGGTLGRSPGARTSWERSNAEMKLITIAGVCNRARFVDSAVELAAPGGHSHGAAAALTSRKTLGDASDSALLRWADSFVPIETLRMVYRLQHEIPFNSVNKWSLAVVKDPGTTPAGALPRHVCMLKGAPEIVITRCTHYLAADGQEKPITEEFKAEWQAAYERFGFLGERVLGFAYGSFTPPALGAAASAADILATLRGSSATAEVAGKAATLAASLVPHNYEAFFGKEEGAACIPKEGLVFAGLVSLIDPPRDGVAEAVKKCRTASIRVVMVTGDHPITAEAIARKVGIITLPTAREVAVEDGVAEEDIALADPRVRAVVRAGSQIRGLTEADWDLLLSKEELVFARTTPEQKLEIVTHLQRLGEVVAVTGDGVNDSPALKKANIGVAMGGEDASDVAREAGDIILLDSNFASIVLAIEEGRVLFDNLKKSIAYTLSHLWPELLPVLLNMAFSIPLAVPGLIILVIDLVTEQGPAISFAYEKAESAVMQLPPRDVKKDRLVTGPLLRYSYLLSGVPSMLVCMGAFFLVFIRAGIPLSVLTWSSGTYFQASSPDLVVNGVVFSAEQQVALYYESVAAYSAMIILNQFWNVWVCKTRFVSMFEHGFMSNAVTLFGVALEVLIVLMVVYIPALNSIFFTGPLSGAIWPMTLIYAAWIFGLTEWYKWAARKNPDGWVAKYIAW